MLDGLFKLSQDTQVMSDQAVDLYYSAVRQREAVREAREWLLDVFADEQRDIRLLNSLGIVLGVERHYEGGYRQFLLDGGNLKEGR